MGKHTGGKKKKSKIDHNLHDVRLQTESAVAREAKELRLKNNCVLQIEDKLRH